MTADRRFGARVVRLAVTSAVALGLIFALWVASHPALSAAGAALGSGWILMPALLLLSLRRPALRYSLAVPAALVTLALIEISLVQPAPALAHAGWLLICGGIVLGGLLGGWFWFRLLPVPRSLDDPFAPGRWALIAVHVGLILAGMGVVAFSELP